MHLVNEKWTYSFRHLKPTQCPKAVDFTEKSCAIAEKCILKTAEVAGIMERCQSVHIIKSVELAGFAYDNPIII